MTDEAKRPIALIHGIGSSFESNWERFGWRELLEESGRSVIPIELPGHGNSPAMPGDEVAALIVDAAEQAGRLDAVGFSAGAAALLVAAARVPERFVSIAMLGVGDSALEENRSASMDRFRETLAAAVDGETEPNPGMPLMIRRLVQSCGNNRSAVAAHIRSSQPAPRLADLGRINARCLVVEGGADAVGRADALAAALPTCTRLTLRGVDHFAIPGEFGCIDAVLHFLDE